MVCGMRSSVATVSLETMRSDLSAQSFPAGLCIALEEYDRLRRETKNYYLADHDFHCPTMRSAWGLSAASARLNDGMKKMTRKGLLQIAARHWDDQPYFKSKLHDYFDNLMGLFYFNAGEMGADLIAAILKRAWAKGSYPDA